MSLTWNEYQALKAIVVAGTATTGERNEGWWSNEILMYSNDEVQMDPKSFSGACGSLSKKGLVISGDYDKNMPHIYPTASGLAAFDAYEAEIARKKALPPIKLSSDTRVRVLINGIGVHCRVGDICSDDIMKVVDQMNTENTKGNRTIGLATTVGTNNIQVDIV